MRLQKFLARAGVASRRASENLMTAGRVSVNGEVVTQLGVKVDPLVDVVRVDGAVVLLTDGPVTIMLHKPAGVITTMKAQSKRAIVADLVPIDRFPGLYPIGRLDADTTGLLLFSTDGHLGNALLHPSRHVPKTYLAELARPLSAANAERLRCGVELEDGPAQPAEVEFLGDGEAPFAQRGSRVSPAGNAHGKAVVRKAGAQGGRTVRHDAVGIARQSGGNCAYVRITVHEGRYHQVKRMFEAVGNKVVRLHRETFGPLTLGDLEVGAWRELTSTEVASLRETASCDS